MHSPINDAALFEEKNFEARADAIDFSDETAALQAVDNKLFQRLQEEIRAGRHRGEAFKTLVYQYVSPDASETGYDNLDVFINRLFPFSEVPEPTKDPEPEMVYYQKTPARIVFELTEHLTREDVFFDLGSGLGQVAILVNLLTGIETKGIEFEPAFCAYAEACADWLRLEKVNFVNIDARQADYGEGTVFFLFTPFRGEMLRSVLTRLQRGGIKIMTYGPCTEQVAKEPWLRKVTPETMPVESGSPEADRTYRLCVFTSSL